MQTRGITGSDMKPQSFRGFLLQQFSLDFLDDVQRRSKWKIA